MDKEFSADELQILRICVEELVDTGYHWSEHWLDDELDAFFSVCRKLSIDLQADELQ